MVWRKRQERMAVVQQMHDTLEGIVCENWQDSEAWKKKVEAYRHKAWTAKSTLENIRLTEFEEVNVFPE